MTPQTKARLIAAVAFPLLLLHGTPSVAAPAATAPASAATETRLDHISIVTMGTTGSPVILIPGLASPRAVWDGVAPELARHHRVLLVQVNGFAGDDPGANLKPGVLDGIVADLDAYLVRHKLGDAAVIGHSMGGLVAMMLAKAHPADVGKLMIVDSLPFFAVLRAPPGVDVTAAMVQPQAAVARDKIAASYGKPMTDADAEAQTKGLALKPGSIARICSTSVRPDRKISRRWVSLKPALDTAPESIRRWRHAIRALRRGSSASPACCGSGMARTPNPRRAARRGARCGSSPRSSPFPLPMRPPAAPRTG